MDYSRAIIMAAAGYGWEEVCYVCRVPAAVAKQIVWGFHNAGRKAPAVAPRHSND